MFSKIFYSGTLFFLATGVPQVFSSPSCGNGFLSSKNLKTSQPENNGIESYRRLLIRLARFRLGVKKFNPRQIKALENYHSVVQGEKGEDKTPARAGNYTEDQIGRIIRYLEKEFSLEQVKTLIENGVIEIGRVEDPAEHSRIAVKGLKKGQVIFVDLINDTQSPKVHSTQPAKIRRVLEKADNGFLAEIEKIDLKSGHSLKKQIFIRVPYKNRFIYGVLEKTDSGFVIRMRTDRRYFFSFKEAIKNGLLPDNPTTQDYRKLEDVLNNYISRRYDQIPALRNAVAFRARGGSLIVTDKETFTKFEKAIRDSLIFSASQFILANPEFAFIFEAVSSTRKKISSDDLNLPPPANTEARLTKQGYTARYTAGLDQIHEWAAVRRRLQELGANPRTTHIEYFAKRIPDHIAHIRQGLEENDSTAGGSRHTQLKRLKDLEKEAKKAISDEKVTYKWWLEFNFRLSEVMAGLSSTGWSFQKQELINSSISHFPLKIIAPTITEKTIGIITFNRASLEGIYPAELRNTRFIIADGIFFNSNDFFIHDISPHSTLQANRFYSGYPASHQLLHKRLLENIEGLPLEERKKAEAVYFIMTHENFSGRLSDIDRTPKEMRHYIISVISHSAAELFKFPNDPVEEQKKIEDLADTFMEVYNQAQQHQ